MFHVNKPVPFERPVLVYTLAVVSNCELQPASINYKFDVSFAAARMAQNVVDALFENQVGLATQIRTKPDIVAQFRRLESKFDITGRKNVAGKTTHAMNQIAQTVSFWIYCPDNVIHRIDQAAR